MTPRDLAQFRACLLELGPTARALALPKGYLNGHQAHEEHQAQGRQDGKGEGGDNSTEKVEKPTDRSSQEA